MKKVNVNRKWKSNYNSRFSDEECQPITSDRNDDNDEFPLEKLPMKPPVVEKPVLPGDTLQTLALRFNSSVSELKRVNNIIWDNELFARRTIKIPCKLFTADHLDDHQPLVQVHLKKIQNETDDPSSNIGSTPTSTSTSSASEKEFEKNIESIMNNKALQKAAMKNHQLNLEKGLAKWKTDRLPEQLNLKFDDDDEEEVDVGEGDEEVHFQLLPSPSSRGPQQPQPVVLDPVQILHLNGSDGGLSWRHLIICILCLCLLIPVLLVLNIADVFAKKDTHNTV